MNGMGLGLPRRLHEIGRLRLGDKVAFTKKDGTEGTRPHKLDKWRLTSQYEAVITHVAEEYGGTPQVWEGAPAGAPQWEVYTEASSLEIYIPTGGLSAAWEMWSGGGAKRRCDGTWMDTGEDCQCLIDLKKEVGEDRFKRLNSSDLLRERLSRAKSNPPRACKPMTRLSVVLPDIPPALTVWRVTTSSVNAGIEMPGTVDLLQGALSNRQLIPARLVIEQRSSLKDGKTTVYPVPVLSLHEVTAAELGRAGAFWVLGEANAGAAQLSAPPDRTALNAGSAEPVAERSQRNGDSVDVKATPVPNLIDRFNALPNNHRSACMSKLREIGFPNIEADRMAEALTIIASYEDGPTDPPPSSEPPSAPRTPPGPPSPGSAPTAPAEAPQDRPETDGPVLARLGEELERAKAPKSAPKPPVDAKSTALPSSDRSSGSPAVEGRSEGIVNGISTYQPAGGGPPLPVGITDSHLYGGANLSFEDEARVDRAWESGGARLLQARLEWLDSREKAKNPRPPLAPGEDHWEPGPIRGKSPVDQIREDLANAKARSGR
jgi:hypothetical protein